MAISPVLVARAAGVDLKVVAVSGVEQQTFIAGSGLAAAVSSAANPAAGFSAFAKASGRPAKIGTLPKGSMPDTALRHYIEKMRLVRMPSRSLARAKKPYARRRSPEQSTVP